MKLQLDQVGAYRYLICTDVHVSYRLGQGETILEKQSKNVTRFNAVPQECMVMLDIRIPKKTPVVGQSWVPEVAQFLIDIAPGLLEYGDSLEDLFPILMDDEYFSDDSFEKF